MIIVVMGVTGAGKTTVGSLLARELSWNFSDADDFHSAANKEKIALGIPLEDADRAPWLAAIRSAMSGWLARKQNVVLACSALKESYRKELQVGPEIRFVYLKGDFELINQRLGLRHKHFAGQNILSSQFATLEEPAGEDALAVSVDRAPEEIVREIRNRLGLQTIPF